MSKILQKYRNSSLITSSLGILIAKIVTIFSQILTTAVLTRSLPSEKFGIWVILFAIFSFSANFDLGIGQVARIKLAVMNAGNTGQASEERYASSALLSMAIIGGVLFAAIFVLFVVLGKWNLFLSIQDVDLVPSVQFLTIFAAMFGISIPISIGNQIFLSYNEGVLRAIFDALQAGALTITTLFLSSKIELYTFMLIYYLVYVTTSMLSLYVFILRRRWKIYFVGFRNTWEVFVKSAKSSIEFWILGLTASIASSTTPIIVGHVADLKAAGDFSIYQRLFVMLTVLHLAVLSPLQSSYTRAITNNQWHWVEDIWRRSYILTVAIFAIVGFVLWALHGIIIRLWTGHESTEPVLVLMIGLWITCWGWINCHSVLLNGMNLIRIQIGILVFSMLTIVIFGSELAKSIGVIGVPIAGIVSLLPGVILMPIFAKNALKNKMEALGNV